MLKIVEVTEVIEDCLYAVRWEGETQDSLEKLISELSDAAYLFGYLTGNETFLRSGYYNELTLSKTVKKIQKEFWLLIEEIQKRANKGPFEPLLTLERLFEPLDGRQSFSGYRQGKVKAHELPQPILRIYGIREDSNRITITGYAIKFTRWMDDHEDSKKEKDKIRIAEMWLRENE